MCLLLNWNLDFPAEEGRNIGSRISLSGYFGHRKQGWGSLLKVNGDEWYVRRDSDQAIRRVLRSRMYRSETARSLAQVDRKAFAGFTSVYSRPNHGVRSNAVLCCRPPLGSPVDILAGLGC